MPPEQVPLEQASLHVVGLLSSQESVLLACWQVPPAQVSFVQGLLSLQSESWAHDTQATPEQVPPEQASLHVSALLSSQEAVLLACWQVPPAQVSFVQGLLSLQSEAWMHAGQAGQFGPPQSIPVSPWFWMPSEQVSQGSSLSIELSQLRNLLHSSELLVGANKDRDELTCLQVPNTSMVLFVEVIL
jgi:hypothetical protein